MFLCEAKKYKVWRAHGTCVRRGNSYVWSQDETWLVAWCGYLPSPDVDDWMMRLLFLQLTPWNLQVLHGMREFEISDVRVGGSTW